MAQTTTFVLNSTTAEDIVKRLRHFLREKQFSLDVVTTNPSPFVRTHAPYFHPRCFLSPTDPTESIITPRSPIIDVKTNMYQITLIGDITLNFSDNQLVIVRVIGDFTTTFTLTL